MYDVYYGTHRYNLLSLFHTGLSSLKGHVRDRAFCSFLEASQDDNDD